MGGGLDPTAILEALDRDKHLLPLLRIKLLLHGSLTRVLVAIHAYRGVIRKAIDNHVSSIDCSLAEGRSPHTSLDAIMLQPVGR